MGTIIMIKIDIIRNDCEVLMRSCIYFMLAFLLRLAILAQNNSSFVLLDIL